MIFSQLTRFSNAALLFLRFMVGIVFITSGWKHLTNADARSKDIGMSKGFTIFLGAAEFAGEPRSDFRRPRSTRRHRLGPRDA